MVSFIMYHSFFFSIGRAELEKHGYKMETSWVADKIHVDNMDISMWLLQLAHKKRREGEVFFFFGFIL